MAFDEHPRVSGADATSADNADRLVLEKVADEESREPTLVLATAHKSIGFHDAAGGREGQGRGKLGRRLRQDSGGIA